MNNEKEAIILGALLHDIGKFMQRAELPCRYERDENEMQRVCKYHKEGDYFSHRHSLWTVDFFETYHNNLPPMPDRLENPDDNLSNFASKHHKPDTSLQWLIAEADRLSSGMDRLPKDEEEEIRGRDSFKRTRLYPILEEITLDGKQKNKISHRIDLNNLTLGKDILFPMSNEKLNPKEGDLLVRGYYQLWQQFIKEFVFMPNENFPSFIETILFLLEKYTWSIPSSTIDLPDISLFDHSKTTAAIAACIYDYHNSHGALEEKYIKDRGDTKYALICGDISGIQKFIYNITSKGAAKGLKGRSFFLQLLAEAVGKYILRQLDYPLTNLLYSSGGKFYLLIANRYEEELEKIRKEINLNLLKKYNGELYLALGWCSLTGSDFEGANFPPKWKEAAQEANNEKKRKFSNLSYKEIFDPSGTGGREETCDICKREGPLKSLREDDHEIMFCTDCEVTERLGERLSKAEYLVEVFDEQKGLDDRGFDITFLTTKYYLLQDISNVKKILGRNVTVYKLNSTDFLNEDLKTNSHAYGFKFAGGTHFPKNERGAPLTFNEFADKSEGLKRLGILRMDVDNLGRIFIRGFGNRASISRVTTLSRNLSLFFNGYLNTICQKAKYKDSISIIYSGGDDLFVVGAWNHIIDLAEEINTEFREFTGNNPAFTLSGGIALITKKYPIYRGAKHAGDAENKAKKWKWKNEKGEKEKDALNLLNKTLSWWDLSISREIKELLYNSIAIGKSSDKDTSNRKLSKGILNRLRRIYILYEKNRAYWRERRSFPLKLILEKLRYHKWIWRSVYTLYKATKENELFREELQLVRTALLENRFNDKRTEREIIELIDIPTRWVEFLLRKEE